MRWVHMVCFSFPITLSFSLVLRSMTFPSFSFSFLSFLSFSLEISVIVITIFLPFIPGLGLPRCFIFVGPIAFIPIPCLISLPFILSPITLISCKVTFSFSLSFSFVPRSEKSSTLSSFSFSFSFSSFSFSFPGSPSLESSLKPSVVIIIPDPKDIF